MIASLSRNFIFIKSRKTGGTSVEMVLSAWCSGADIVTPISGEDEITRRALGGRPDNFGATAWDAPLLRAATLLRAPRVFDFLHSRRRRAWPFYNHMPAAGISKALPDLWGSAFKFTIERDPFEKVVSLAWFDVKRQRLDRSVAQQVDRVIAKKDYLNFPLYSIGGEIAVDEVVPYDHMWERLAGIATRLGTRLPTDIPRAKGRFRTDRSPAVDVLSESQKRQIRSDAEVEFDLLHAARQSRPKATALPPS